MSVLKKRKRVAVIVGEIEYINIVDAFRNCGQVLGVNSITSFKKQLVDYTVAGIKKKRYIKKTTYKNSNCLLSELEFFVTSSNEEFYEFVYSGDCPVKERAARNTRIGKSFPEIYARLKEEGKLPT